MLRSVLECGGSTRRLWNRRQADGRAVKPARQKRCRATALQDEPKTLECSLIACRSLSLRD